MSYAELDRLASAVAGRLRGLGVPRGARIGLYLRRSTDAIAAMLGTLRAGCAYVSLDPRAPVDRNAAIQAASGVHLTLVEDRFEAAYRERVDASNRDPIAVQRLGSVGMGTAIAEWALGGDRLDPADASAATELACILYTSGTTGRPKGWMMTRRAIEAHVRWCHDTLGATRDDRFANHAQFNFGMSLFDIYSSLGCGAALVLVPDEVRQHAARVVDLLARERVTIWFSGVAVLALIARLDDIATRDLSALRVLAFAGEVFPEAQLAALRNRLPRPHPRIFNFYGSTETNVAAFHELLPDDQTSGQPPMGRPCAHYAARVVGGDGRPVEPGQTGELQLRGVGLTSGYWDQPAATADKLAPADDGGEPWLRTGDLVVELPTGDLRYVGRIGRMLKVRGYRVEPGEIEARLYEHPAIGEAAVVAVPAADGGIELVAHVSTLSGDRLPVVELKEFCAAKLPAYMIPSRFEFHAALPRTSTGKRDLQSLHTLTAKPLP